MGAHRGAIVTGAASSAVEDSSTRDGDRAGYVLDNMEGAVDRAAFLAKTDMPIAIIGARGTGKMYVARVVHKESGGAPDGLLAIDCRTFRNREAANRAIDAVLRDCAGRTVVFKYPHLMCVDAQVRLARQLTSRTLADTQPPRSLPRAKFVALLPDTIERLVREQLLTERLGSVFAGYPIYVPPIRDRQRAVLRWADKIVRQECRARGCPLRQFTPEAERAMLGHSWEGNISEMRERIVRALETTGGDWLTPADLGLFAAPPPAPVSQPLLDGFGGELSGTGDYRPSCGDELEQRIAEAVHRTLGRGEEQALGTWLEDALVLAVLRCSADQPARAARSLGTTSRNVQRWLPRIRARAPEREACGHWGPMEEAVRRWAVDALPAVDDPLAALRNLVLRQLETQGAEASVRTRAAILGVSVPTYYKRLRQWREGDAPRAGAGSGEAAGGRVQ